MKVNIKPVLICIMSLCLCLVLCACESENLKKAREAYDSGNYTEAIELLNAEDSTSDSAKELLGRSKAKLASEEGDYSAAIGELIAIGENSSSELYQEILQSAIASANLTGDSTYLVGILQQDSSNGDVIFEAMETEAKAGNIKAYRAMDGISSSADLDEVAIDQFSTFLRENGEQRARALLIGTWEFVENEKKRTRVEIKPQGDNLIGIVSQVGDGSVKYQLQKGDVYWKEFVFLEPTQFTCTNLAKTTNGVPVPCTAVGTLDFSTDDEFSRHLTADIGLYNVINPDRVWIRVSE